MKAKILIIARAFPPISGGGVQRIVKFSIYLEQLGYDVTVCSLKNEQVSWKDETRKKELNKINIIRIATKEVSAGFINKVKRKLTFFDSYNSWAKSVIVFFKQKGKFDFDFVLTSGPPHSMHKIGLELKKEYNFFWVSDFRDHYTLGPGFHPLTRFHKRIEKKFEQKIYDFSDLIITNTEINKREVLKSFEIRPESKIKTIYNGYDLGDLKLSEEKPDYIQNKINLLYLGGLRGDKIDGYFYKMVKVSKNKAPSICKNLRINLVGDLSRRGDMIEKLDIVDIFKFYKSLPFDKVGNYINASDGCLTWQNPNNAYKGTIAGKVFDYIGLKKPIFSLGQPNSELSAIINTNKIGIHTDVNDIDKAADDFILFLKNIDTFSKSYKTISKEFYNSFNRKNQVSQLNSFLMNIDGV